MVGQSLVHEGDIRKRLEYTSDQNRPRSNITARAISQELPTLAIASHLLQNEIHTSSYGPKNSSECVLHILHKQKHST